MNSWGRIPFGPIRFFAIYVAFFLIAFGSAILGFLLIPFWEVLVSRKLSAENYRKVISRGVRLYLWLLHVGRLLDVSYDNFEKISKNEATVIVANHPSLLDILFFFAKFPTCCCIVKDDLARFSPYAPLIHGAAYLKNSSVEILEEAKVELSRGNPIVVFPEGTRSDYKNQENGMLKLQRGAANIALRCGCNIFPIEIDLSPLVLGRNQAWYNLPTQRCSARLKLGSVITVDIQDGESVQSAARRITAQLEDLFSTLLRK